MKKRYKFVEPNYYEYIVSKSWKNKRKEAFNYYGRKCSVCKSEYNLQVHHKTYDRLGREKMIDLEILCYDCHCVEHEKEHPFIVDRLTEEYRNIIG